MQEQIWKAIAGMKTFGFFITAEIGREGSSFPSGLENYIREKLEAIGGGVAARRFVFKEEGWRIYLTFFPTDRVVDEKYALKNKVVARKYGHTS